MAGKTPNYWPGLFLAVYVYLLSPAISVILSVATFRQSSFLYAPSSPLKWWQLGLISAISFSYFLGLAQVAKAATTPSDTVPLQRLFLWLFLLVGLLITTSLFSVA